MGSLRDMRVSFHGTVDLYIYHKAHIFNKYHAAHHLDLYLGAHIFQKYHKAHPT